MNLSPQAKAVILAVAKRISVEDLDYAETDHGTLVNHGTEGVWLCKVHGVCLRSGERIAQVLHTQQTDWNVWACDQAPSPAQRISELKARLSRLPDSAALAGFIVEELPARESPHAGDRFHYCHNGVDYFEGECGPESALLEWAHSAGVFTEDELDELGALEAGCEPVATDGTAQAAVVEVTPMRLADTIGTGSHLWSISATGADWDGCANWLVRADNLEGAIDAVRGEYADLPEQDQPDAWESVLVGAFAQ